MSAYDRAADIICHEQAKCEGGCDVAAHALAEAGLLVTDEIQAVLDLVLEDKFVRWMWEDFTPEWDAAVIRLRHLKG